MCNRFTDPQPQATPGESRPPQRFPRAQPGPPGHGPRSVPALVRSWTSDGARTCAHAAARAPPGVAPRTAGRRAGGAQGHGDLRGHRLRPRAGMSVNAQSRDRFPKVPPKTPVAAGTRRLGGLSGRNGPSREGGASGSEGSLLPRRNPAPAPSAPARARRAELSGRRRRTQGPRPPPGPGARCGARAPPGGQAREGVAEVAREVGAAHLGRPERGLRPRGGGRATARVEALMGTV